MGLVWSLLNFGVQSPLLAIYAARSLFGIPKEKQFSFEFGAHHEHEGRPHRAPDGIPTLITRPSNGLETLYELMQWTANRHGKAHCMGSRPLLQTVSKDRTYTEAGRQITKKWTFFEMGKYRWLTYRDVVERAGNFGRGLVSLGLEPGAGRIAIHLETCPEWMLAAHGCFTQSLTASTIYATLGEAGLVHILQEGEIPLLVTDSDNLPIVARVAPQCPTLKHVVYIGTPSDEKLAALNKQGLSTHAFTRIEELGAQNEGIKPLPPKNADVALIMYTSGTTGPPKGVMITHANMVAMLGATESVVRPMRLSRNDVFIAYLPLAHVLEFVIEHTMMFNGVPVGYGNPRTLTKESMHNSLGDLEELRPTLMAGVPRVWDKIRKEVLDQISKRPAWQQNLAAGFFRLKRLCLEAGVNADVLDRLFFNNIRKAVGGRLRIILSGAAPLSEESHWFLRAAISPVVLIGYGLTETTGFSTLMRPDQLSTGSVGSPAASVEIKLVDVPDLGYTSNDQPLPRGEVWIRGSTVTLGYFRNEAKTREAYRDGGWFVTGDIGRWNRDGTLSIIDRCKNLIKLSNGEYIAPERLESLYALSPYVETVMVHGDSMRDYAVALIVPARKQLLDWAAKNGINKSYEELCDSPEATKEVHASLEHVAARQALTSADRPKRVLLLSEPWTAENDMLTVTAKLKRQSVAKRFADEIRQLYES